MKAFHGKQEIKKKYLSRVKAHRLADNLIQGTGWEDGKGCAVGCTLESYNHQAYEKELGIPEWLARLEDTIFEGLKEKKAMLWPEKFLSAIKPGANLDKVKTPFLVYILNQNLITLDALPEVPGFPDVEKAVELTREVTKEMIRCHETGEDLSAAYSAARSAESAAWSARSAYSAAESAARSAESAAYSAYSAAESAYSAAESAARSAESAAYSAAESAYSAAESAAYSAYSAAESAESAAVVLAVYEKYASKLIELIKKCK